MLWFKRATALQSGTHPPGRRGCSIEQACKHDAHLVMEKQTLRSAAAVTMVLCTAACGQPERCNNSGSAMQRRAQAQG